MADSDPKEICSLEEMHEMPGHLIRRCLQIMVGIFHDETHEFDLTPVQFAALVTIDAEPGIDQISLAGSIGYDRTTIGGVIDRLESKGLIRREVGRTDRRLRMLFMTPEGERKVRDAYPAVLRAQYRMVAPLTARERRSFIALLAKLVHAQNDMSRSPLRKRTSRRGKAQRSAGESRSIAASSNVSEVAKQSRR